MLTTIDVQWDKYMQCGRHICSGVHANKWNICIPVLLVTMLTAVSSYEAYIDIVVSCKHRWEMACLLLRSPGTELFKSAELYSEDGLEMAMHRWHWGSKCMSLLSLLGDRAYQVNMNFTRRVELKWSFLWQWIRLWSACSPFRSPRIQSLLSRPDSVFQIMVFKRPVMGDWGNSACSMFRSPKVNSFKLT